MKRIVTILLMIFVLAGCGENVPEQSKSTDNYEGIYVFDYKNDTPELVENHYIVIENIQDKIAGRYYGTSDDFDSAREGYYPGFFVADMRNLQINANEISFEVYLTENDMFSKPVDLKYKYTKDVPANENPLWDNKQIIDGSDSNPKKYKGKIANGEITLETDSGSRIFYIKK